MNVIHVQTHDLVQGKLVCPKISLGDTYLQGDDVLKQVQSNHLSRFQLTRALISCPQNPNAADHSFYVEQQSW